MAKVEFQDFSFQVKAAINKATQNWLVETASEIESQAIMNCSREGWTSEEYQQLRGGYKSEVYPEKGVAIVGHRQEMAYWEEFGTGSHADTSKNGGKEGRAGWWIYTPGSDGHGGESNVYPTREAAEDMAAYIRATYNKEAIVTNGRRPNYTLEKAFKTVRPEAEADLEKRLKRELE